MIMDENIIQSKLEKMLPCYYEVQVWHPTAFISVEILSIRNIVLPSDVLNYLVSLHIKEMHFGYHCVSQLHHVSFKLLG